MIADMTKVVYSRESNGVRRLRLGREGRKGLAQGKQE